MSTTAIWTDRRRWSALAALVVCLLVIGLDTTVLYVALPELANGLHTTNSQLQWIFNAYLLVFAGLMLFFGVFADRFGRRRVLFGGLVVFGLASAGATVADNASQLIAARAVMGVGAAIIMPVSLSMLPVLFAPKERARALAIWSAGVSLGLPIGPLAGGWLLEHFWWGAIFAINIPIVLVALAAGAWLFPESKDETIRQLDWPGALLSTLGLVATTYAVIEAQSRGWLSLVTVLSFVLGLVFLAAFVLQERRSSHPLLQLGLFADRRFTQSTIALTLVYFALLGFLYLLTPYLQTVRGASSLGTGVRLLPLVLAIIVGALTAERVAVRTGPRGPVVSGLILIAGGLAMFIAAGINTGDGYIASCLAIMGAGVGLALATAVHAALASLPDDKAGVAAGLTSAFRQVGGAFGVAVLGSVLGTAYRERLAPALGSLPRDAAYAAREEIGGAAQVANHLGPAREALLSAARAAYVESMHIAVVIAAALVAFVVAVCVLIGMPGGRPPHQDAEVKADRQDRIRDRAI